MERNSPCSWIGIINILKIFIVPKYIYKFNAISINILMVFFTKVEKIFLKVA